MSKQSEIREGIKGKLRERGCEDGFGDLDLEDAVDLFLAYLHSRGVVIKGEHICGQCIRGLADSIHSGASTVCPACHGNYRTLVVEPLIEVE